MISHWFLALLLLIFIGCSPSSQEEIRSEGEEVCRLFIQELQKIHNKEEVLKHYASIKKKYSKIASLMAAAMEMNEYEGERDANRNKYSNDLYRELARLYEIPGVKEILEKAQAEAIKESRITNSHPASIKSLSAFSASNSHSDEC